MAFAFVDAVKMGYASLSEIFIKPIGPNGRDYRVGKGSPKVGFGEFGVDVLLQREILGRFALQGEEMGF